MTRERLEELERWTHWKEPDNAYAAHVYSLASLGAPESIRAAVARLLLERERAVKALKWEYEEGEGLSQESVKALAFVEEEA